jgi:hypothetical protein
VNARYSLLRLNRALSLYAAAERPVPRWRLSEDEWVQLAELEAVMNLCKDATTLVQTERYAMAALDWLIKQRVLDSFRADHLMVVDLLDAGETTDMRRVERKINDLSAVGQTARLRGTLEMERRYCGNRDATDVSQLNNQPVVLTERARMACMLDPRVFAVFKEKHKALVRATCRAIRDEYVRACVCKVVVVERWSHR